MEEKVSCENQPLWYKQLFKMSEAKRLVAVRTAMEKIKEAKPEAAAFIQKFNCKLVGFVPNVVYTMPDDSKGALSVNFVHKFSQTTLVFWCDEGGFSFFVNASLHFDDDMGFTY